MALTGCVHVIDEDLEVRQAVAGLLGDAGCEAVLHDSAQAFLRILPEVTGACVVADLDSGGLELLLRMAQSGPRLPAVLLASGCQVRTAVEAFRSGACDLVEKPVQREPLLAAVAEALEAAARLAKAEALRADSANRLGRLTGRERDVLQGLVDGLTNKEIARVLAISPRTVEAHRSHVMLKMGTSRFPDLVRMSLLAEAA